MAVARAHTASLAVAGGVWTNGASGARDVHLVGVIDGEGVGPEVVGATLDVLEALAETHDVRIGLRRLPPMPLRDGSRASHGELTDAVAAFCHDVFAAGGAVLAGAVGGRFVYDLRTRFDLYCKLVPLRPLPGLVAHPRHAGADVLLVRENVSGLYQGHGAIETSADGERRATHVFSYGEAEVRRIVAVGARLARQRRGGLAVVVKDGGVPAVSALWRETAAEIARAAGVRLDVVNIDLAAYRLVQEPELFDVVVAPNLFGDVLADVGAVLLGGRGVSFSGNFGPDGRAVYQTNHGAALDLAGTDRANPVGQVLSLAMLLRESAGRPDAAAAVEAAVASVWADGWRTPDVHAPGCLPIGTRELGRRIAGALERRTITAEHHDASAPAR